MTNRALAILTSATYLIALLSACSAQTVLAQNERYTILAKGKQHFLSFNDSGKHGQEEDSMLTGVVAVCYPKFESVADMQQRVLRGELAEEELSALRRSASSDGTLEICDMNHLYDLQLPADMYTDYILWYGAAYDFEIRGEELVGYISYRDKEYYEEAFQKEHYLNENQTVLTEEVVEDRNATIMHYRNNTGDRKMICYEIVAGNKTISVIEKYMKITDTVPASVNIFGTENGTYFYGWLTEFDVRPSLEWLSAFGLCEFEKKQFHEFVVPISVSTYSG